MVLSLPGLGWGTTSGWTKPPPSTIPRLVFTGFLAVPNIISAPLAYAIFVSLLRAILSLLSCWLNAFEKPSVSNWLLKTRLPYPPLLRLGN
jgi:hypothetical protein